MSEREHEGAPGDLQHARSITSARDVALIGAEHLERYRRRDAEGLDGRTEVDAAVDAFQQAVAAAGSDVRVAPAYAYNLAIALQSRYDAVGAVLGDERDLREAVAVLEGAVTISAPPHPYAATVRYGLGSALRRLHRTTHDPRTLERAIGLLGDALAIGTPDTLDQADAIYEYGRALLAAAELDDTADLLDEAVRALEELAEDVDPDAPDRAAYTDAAGSARLLRFDRTGRGEDLVAALGLARRAVEMQRRGGRVTAAALANLGGALFTRAIQQAVTGPEVDEAIAVTREALSIARGRVGTAGPASAEARDRLAGIQSNLAGILLARVERSGDLAALDEVVELADGAVLNSPGGGAALGGRAHQLAVARRTRYIRLGDPADLDAAAAAHRLALGSPVTEEERRVLLDGWANTLRTRFDRGERLEDLRAAVTAYEEALDGTDRSSPDRGGRLNNLGAALAALAEATGDSAIGERARTALREAVGLTRPGTLERVRALVNLGNVFAEQYDRSHREEDRRAAEDAYWPVRRSADLAACSTESVLQAALNAGDWALDREDWPGAVDWLERALEAVEDLIVVQRRRTDKESWLRDARGASIRAAVAALANGDACLAVTLLERGRALLLREATEQAALDLDALDTAGAHELRQRLEALGGETVWSEPVLLAGRALRAPATQDLRRLRDEVRRVAGFEDFLAPPTFDDVAAAAIDAPLAYLTSSPESGFALIVRGRSVTHIPLPEVTDASVREQVDALFTAHEEFLAAPVTDRAARDRARRTWSAMLDRVGAWLWAAVGAPLSAELTTHAVNVVAGGLLGLLPLHAAHRQDTLGSNRRFLGDDVRLSYVPSAQALSTAAARARDTLGHRLLVVAQPEPTALPLLDGTHTEALVVAAAFGRPPQRPVVLAGEDAAADVVVAALRDCDVAHFGCHGTADLARPLASALLLGKDVPLTLARVLGLRLNLRLAVLSACETGRPGTQLPDEVVSLPTGLLQAGVAGVVASGWAVPDASTTALMAEFYRGWRYEQKAPGEALAAAQAWLRDTTNGEKVAAWEKAVGDGAAWLPPDAADELLDVYLVREPDALDDSGLDVWAGFAHFGS